MLDCDGNMRARPLAAGPLPGFEQAYVQLANLLASGELSRDEAEAEWKRIQRGRTPLTIETYAAQLRRHTVLQQRRQTMLARITTRARAACDRVPFRPSGGTRRRSRRTVRAAAHGPPGREPSEGDDPPPPDDLAPLDPPARILYERAASFRGDKRVAEWLERWADEVLEEQAA